MAQGIAALGTLGLLFVALRQLGVLRQEVRNTLRPVVIVNRHELTADGTLVLHYSNIGPGPALRVRFSVWVVPLERWREPQEWLTVEERALDETANADPHWYSEISGQGNRAIEGHLEIATTEHRPRLGWIGEAGAALVVRIEYQDVFGMKIPADASFRAIRREAIRGLNDD